MKFGEIFNKAWKIIKKFKVLWVLGFLAGCGAVSGSGGGNTGFQFSGRDFSNGNHSFNGPMPGWMGKWGHWNFFDNEQVWIWIVVAIIVLFVIATVLGLLTLVLRTIGRGGLARGAWDADEGRKKITFKELWKCGVQHFWKVLLFTGLIWLIGLGLTLLLIVPVILFSVFTLLCGLIFIIPALIVLSWAVTALWQLGVVAIIGDEMEVMDAFRHSWDLLFKNFWRIILFSLIVAVGTFIVGLILFLPFLLTVLPVLIGLALEAKVMTVWIILTAVLFLVYLVAVIILGAGVQAYLGTAWTLLYRRLTGRMGKELCSVEEVEPAAPAPEEVKPDVPEAPEPREVLPGETRQVADAAEPLPDPEKPV
ncbi:MAG TPA: hypothetical protein PK174_08295 [Anaerolineaceae bacterium]|nr:hypothetical protein [Anaerolineaceae bacterium]HQN05402.1 hypothetical protein [Anaerolineaceae bacterium]